MIRRPQLTEDSPQELGNDYRKKRSYISAPRGTHSSIMRAQAYKPESGAELGRVQSNWIGKRFVPVGSESIIPYIAQSIGYVKETDIALNAGGFNSSAQMYRIIIVGDNGLMFYDDPVIQKNLMARNMLNVEYQPSRMNILVDRNSIIRDVRYF